MGKMDDLISPEAVRALPVQLGITARHGAEFESAAAELESRTLRQRVDLVRDVLTESMPGSISEVSRSIRTAYDSPEFTGWILWPVSELATARALADGGESAFDEAMDLLALITTRFTGEFAIRSLLRERLERAIAIAEEWAQNDSVDVRRLASEGTRSYLPWAIRVPALTQQPEATHAIVDALHNDPAEFVRRSVANHLNDQSRDHPDHVVGTIRSWADRADPVVERVARHALRTLVKRSHPGALEELGFHGGEVLVEQFRLSQHSVRMGETLDFSAELRNTGSTPARIAVDYVIEFLRSNGQRSPKVFKLTTQSLTAGQTVRIRREHSFREITTRRYYPGVQGIRLQVNGAASESLEFRLTQN